MATLTVGVGKEFSTIKAAVAASHNGDVVQVQAGTYKNDFATISTSITLQAVGGRVNMVATIPPPNLKGMLTIGTTGSTPDVSITGFSFSGVHIKAGAGGNGAGIRYQSGNLTLSQDWFHGNQDGLLATPFVTDTGSITIDHSEFGFNGSGTGQTHNLYVGMIGSLSITNSYFHDAKVGHEIKSRAEVNTIENNRIFANNGTDSYSIDLPNGGRDIVSGNVIEKGLHSENNKMIAFLEAPGSGDPHVGSDQGHWGASSLMISGNTFVNDKASPNTIGLWNANTMPLMPTVADNSFWNISPASAISGPASMSGTNWLTSRPILSTAHPWS